MIGAVFSILNLVKYMFYIIPIGSYVMTFAGCIYAFIFLWKDDTAYYYFKLILVTVCCFVVLYCIVFYAFQFFVMKRGYLASLVYAGFIHFFTTLLLGAASYSITKYQIHSDFLFDKALDVFSYLSQKDDLFCEIYDQCMLMTDEQLIDAKTAITKMSSIFLLLLVVTVSKTYFIIKTITHGR